MSTSVHPLLGLMQPTANSWRCAGKVRAILFWYSALVQRVELLCLLSAAYLLPLAWVIDGGLSLFRKQPGNPLVIGMLLLCFVLALSIL